MPSMTLKHCKTCGVTGPHNPMKKGKDQEQSYRCCTCGHPITTNIAMKREVQERTRDRIVLRLRLLGGR